LFNGCCIEKERCNAARVRSLLFCLVMILGIALVPLVTRPLSAAAAFTTTPAIAGGGDSGYALKPDGTVYAWGCNEDGQLGNSSVETGTNLYDSSDVPVQVQGLSGITAIAGGILDGYALDSSGNVWAWGDNQFGELGNSSAPAGANQISSSAVQVSGLSNITAIASNGYAGYALDSNDHVWAWGYNNDGQLGATTGSSNFSKVPVQVASLTGIKAISGGRFSGYALDSGGHVWTWGSSANNSTTPVEVSSLSSVTAIAGGANGGYALKSNGTVWAWGSNSSGQLGNNSTTSSNVPVEVANLSGVTAIAVGDTDGYALTSGGTVWAWGYNGDNELGNGAGGFDASGNVIIYDIPVQVSNLSGVTALASGTRAGYALLPNDTVWAWGYNLWGDTGNNSTAQSLVPVQVSGLNLISASQTPAPAIATPVYAGASSVSGTATPGASVMLSVNGTAQPAVTADTNGNWTVNVPVLSAGATISVTGLASGLSVSYPSTTTVAAVTVSAVTNPGGIFVANGTALAGVGLPATVQVKLNTGATPSLGVTWDGGNPAYNGSTHGRYTFTGTLTMTGVITNPNNLTASVTVTVSPPPATTMPAIGAGGQNGYAVDSSGTVWSWGYDLYGELGNGASGNGIVSYSPVQAYIPSVVKAVAGGAYDAYALDTGGHVWAWGRDDLGQMGNGTSGHDSSGNTLISNVPVEVPSLSEITAIAAGWNSAYALDSSGHVWAWGYNSYGQLGNGQSGNGGTSADSSVPVQVHGLPFIKAIAAGTQAAYALDDNGGIWSWGYNGDGELGNGTAANSSLPVQVSGNSGALSGFTAIASNGPEGYALKADGTVWAWGFNYSGQLGDGKTASSEFAVQVSNLTGITAIAAGYALDSSGHVWAWGYNGYGGLGNNSTTNSSVPVPVSNLSNVAAIAAGGNGGYALKSDGTLWAWGYNPDGELGNGTNITSHIPVQITSLTLPIPALTAAPVIDTPIYAGATSVSGTAEPDASILLSVNGVAQPATTADGDGKWTVSVPALNTGDILSATAQSAGKLPSAPAEAEVIAPVTVSSVINQDDITVDNQTNLAGVGLPPTVQVNMSDGSIPSVEVAWDGGSPAYDGNTAGNYTFTGTLTMPGGITNPNNLTASLTVTVQAPAPIEPTLAAGDGSAYALDAGGFVWAWGDNYNGQVGSGVTDNYENFGTHMAVPVKITNLSGVKGIAAGYENGYALKEDGTVWAWGDDQHGQLGSNAVADSSVPVQVYGLNGIKAIAGGGMAAYALQQNGTLWAWGDNYYGELGNGSSNGISATPVQVTGLGGLKIVAIAAGYYSAYALDSTGHVWAWGWNFIGQLGNGTIPASGSPVPVQVSGLPFIKSIAAGQSVAFALDSSGNVWGWGRNGNGELEMNPVIQGSTEPVQIYGLSGIKAIATSWALTAYALKSDGTVWDWGDGSFGALGNGDHGTTGNPVGEGYYSAVPVQVSNLSGITAIAAGYALDANGNAWAWGYSLDGELGNGTDNNSSGPDYSVIPVEVSGLNLNNLPVTATLGVSSPNVLANGTVLVYATVTNQNGTLDTAGDASVSVTVTGLTDPVTLTDDGTGGDLATNDGVYSAWVNIPGPGPATISLTVNDNASGSTTVNVISDPTLAVITDLKALDSEFLNTGMSAQEDLDKNGVPDFYDLIARLNQYAGAHRGIIFDLAQEITAANGYSKDYSSLRYGTDDVAMGKLIDAFTSNLGAGHSIKDIAIVGDDSVVPFYRRPDLPNTGDPESDYPGNTPGDLGSNFGNPTLIDSGANYIMTDVPYACFGIDPDTSNFPVVEAGIGRIFAGHPGQLAQIIDGYETPVDLDPSIRTAEVFNLHNETSDNPPLVNWPNAVKLALKPVLDKYFKLVPNSAVILPGQYFQKNGQVMGWTPGSLASSLQQADITLLWSHATHLFQITEPEDGPAIVAGTYSGIPNEPGHVLISTGCHSGYSVGRVSSSGDYTPYDQSLVNSLISKEITYLAPTTYGIGDEKHGVAYHDLLASSFLGDLLNANTRTVGDAQMQAYGQYWPRSESGGYMDNISTYAAFGTELYGLPTQPVDPPSQTLQPAGGSSGINKDVRAVSGDPSLSFSVDTSNFQVTTDDQGNDLFQVPGDGSFLVNAFAPYIPLVEKNILLPAGASVNSVTQTGVSSSVYQGEVSLETETPVNETSGPIQGSFTSSGHYPANTYWWSTAPADGGVMLTVSVAPMQYDPDTKQVTLFNHLDFDVDYTVPAANASIDNIEVNNGSPLATGLASAPVKVNLSSSSSQSATLLWEARDRSGALLDSGNGNLQLASGTSSYDFTLNTSSFGPGPVDLSVALSVYGSIYDAQTLSLMVDGIGLDASPGQDTYYTGQTGSASVTVWDETGAPVSSLGTPNFTATVDGTSVSASVYGNGDGTYALDFPAGSLGAHTLTIECADSRGMTSSTTLQYAVAADTTPPSWPPGSSLTDQGLTSGGMTLTWTPATDDAGVSSYAVYENGNLLSDQITGTSYQVTSLEANTPYSFEVEAGDAAGNWSTGGPALDVTTPANTGTAASIIATAGDNQSAVLGTAFSTDLQVKVMDSGGNPVPGVTVTFTAPSAGASGAFAGAASTATATTDAQGTATAPAFTANDQAGDYTVTASAPGAASTATFRLTNSSSGQPPGGNAGVESFPVLSAPPSYFEKLAAI
jgi:alpha-tubulin suppressor-like RCC1 family protein